MPNHPSKGTYGIPVSTNGTSETGRGFKTTDAIKKQLAQKPGKLQQTETGKEKKDFRP